MKKFLIFVPILALLYGCASFPNGIFGNGKASAKAPVQMEVTGTSLPPAKPVAVEGVLSERHGKTVFKGHTKKAGIDLAHWGVYGLGFIVFGFGSWIANAFIKATVVPVSVIRRSLVAGVLIVLAAQALSLYGWLIALIAVLFGVYIVLHWLGAHTTILSRFYVKFFKDSILDKFLNAIFHYRKPTPPAVVETPQSATPDAPKNS